MKTSFIKYLKGAPKHLRKRLSDEVLLADLIDTNLSLIKHTIQHAERIPSWGANVHSGNQYIHELKGLWEFLKVKTNRITPEYENLFFKACRIRQMLGDLIFRAEHDYK